MKLQLTCIKGILVHLEVCFNLHMSHCDKTCISIELKSRHESSAFECIFIKIGAYEERLNPVFDIHVSIEVEG